MAFSSKGIRRAIANETYRPEMNYGHNTSATPYMLVGNGLSECCMEANRILLREAYEFRELRVGSDEILYEAALTNNPRYEILVESVVDSVKAKVLAFLQKAYQVALGIIEKLKGFVYQLIGKTGKWVETMRPRIEAGMKSQGINGLTHEMYDWDDGYIVRDLPAGIASLHKTWEAKVSMYIRDNKELQALKQAQASSARVVTPGEVPAEQGGTAAVQNQAAGGATIGIKHDIDQVKAHLQQTVSSMPAEAGKAFKVNVNGGSIDDVWNNIILRAHNGNQEKSEISLANRAQGMLAIVAGCGETLNTIVKAYQDHSNALKNYRTSLEHEGADMQAMLQGGKVPSEAASAAAEYVKAKFDYAITVTQEFESLMSRGNALTTQLVKAMVSEYMAGLAKVAALA